MGLTCTPVAIPGILALLTGAAMAALVYRSRPTRSQNQRLALLLLVDGVGFGALGLMYASTDPSTAAGFVGVLLVTILLGPWLYLAFLSTIDSPLVSWIRGPRADLALVAGAVGSVLAYLLAPTWFVADIEAVSAYGNHDWVGGPLGAAAFLALLVAALFGLAVAVSLYRRTPASSPRRATAGSYLLAFGLRDSLNLFGLVFLVGSVAGAVEAPALLERVMGAWMPQLTFVLFALLLGYGILRTQLFGIDLTIKWTLEKSTVAGVFALGFLVVSEGIEVLLDVDGTLYGIAAAVIIGVTFRRVEDAAQGLADRLMPGVQDTAAYRQRRARELYRATVEAAADDGRISGTERRMLDRLQDELGLSDPEVQELEVGTEVR